MNLVALAASLLQTLASVVIGIHLLRLGLRTRQILELSIGLSWLSGAAANLSWLVAGGGTQTGPAAFASRVFVAVGGGVIIAVVWWIFRRRSPWATALAVFTIAGLALEVTGLMVSVSNWFRAVPYTWLGVEALLEQGRLRRQLRFGLERDRSLADQMFFLSMAGLTAAILYLTLNVWSVILGSDPSFPIREVAATLAILSAGCSWLAFIPPRLYLEWARGRSHHA